MEKKQLDFNAPLLSVRRFSSPLASNRENGKIAVNSMSNRRHSLPPHKPDSDLDQVTEPVAVPFLWEHIPGQAKNGSGFQSRSSQKPSVSPRLPLARAWDVIQHPSEKKLKDRNMFRSQRKASHVSDNLIKLESSKEGMNENGSSVLQSDDDTYSDALDILSSTDSFSPNCSVSGLSGSDGLDEKPSGTFSTDPKTLDFMMSRFLPAAKAMVLEAPKYVSKKQPAATEQPRQLKKVSTGDRKTQLNQYGSTIIPYYGQDKEEEESEDEDDDYSDSGNVSAKACGFLHRFHLRNSLCLLNPVPGMKAKTHFPKSSSFDVRRIAKPTFIRPQSQTFDTHALDTEVKNKQTIEYNQFTYSSDLQTREGFSPYRRSGDGVVSPYRNDAPQSPFHEGMGFLGVPKPSDDFKGNTFNLYNKVSDKEALSPRGNGGGLVSVSTTAEKTLYIDSVSTVEYSRMDSSGENFEISEESRRSKEASTEESSSQDIRCLSIMEGEDTLKPEVSGYVDADLPSYSDISSLTDQDRGLNHGIQKEQTLQAEAPKSFEIVPIQSTLPPPLPKSPSESWLLRTLPSISSPKLFLSSRKLTPQTSSSGTKWETIVKTSKLHSDHVRYSEELITRVPKQSKN